MRTTALSLLTNTNITNRKQKVKIDSECSDGIIVNRGIPQDLGPIPFWILLVSVCLPSAYK